MSLTALGAILLIHLLAAISPGPSFAVSVRVAINDGFRAAVALAFGFGLGAVIWALAALLGLALLFELVPGLFTAIQYAGAAFLAYIAWQIWSHAPDPLPQRSDGAALSPGRAFRMGFTTFATNPKPAVFFGAVFAGLVPPGTSAPWLALIALGVFLNETLWYILVARVFSLNRARSLYARIKPWVDRALALIIFAFAVKIALG